ncbi:MAG: hypothetical protein RL708_517 [Bacteroidota bacterium]|jgi:hypothetical protein
MFNFMQAWHHQSPASCYFSPTNTFENKGDKFVQYWPGLVDSKGNCYYTSFPPFSFQLCYFLWWLTNFSNIETVFFTINILFHFAAALLCMLSVIKILAALQYKSSKLAALFTFSAVLFTPITFWFFADYFFIENVALLLTAFFIYAISSYYANNSTYNFGMVLFSVIILCYTEAIGYFAAFTFFIFIYTEQKKWLSTKAIAVVFGSGFILLLTFFQYGLIEGWQPMLHNFAVRFMGRSGFFGAAKTENGVGIFSVDLYIYAWHIIKVGVLALGLLFIALIISFFVRIKSNEISNELMKKKFWWFVSLPILMHCFIFINANALHDQLMVKLVLPLSILCGVLIGIFSEQKKSRWAIYGFAGLLIGIMYYPIMFAESMGDEGVQQAAQKFIHQSSPQKSMIVICDKNQFYQAPSLFYHSNRNYFLLPDTLLINDAKQRLITDSSIIFKVDANWQVESSSTIANH